MGPRAEWRRAAFFAEVAEALAINTTQIMGVMDDKGISTVLFTREPGLDADVWAARLSRDADGIFVVMSVGDTGRDIGAFLPPQNPEEKT